MASDAVSAASVTVSVVSHRHGELVSRLLSDLASCPQIARVLLTLNVPEPELESGIHGQAHVLRNSYPKGFGTNHNAAFQLNASPYFAVVNPDIRVDVNPFPDLLACLEDARVAMCAPTVVNSRGAREDSVRQFPTLHTLIRKALGGHDGRLAYAAHNRPFAAPWVAGMFMLFRSAEFGALGGFDEDFFLYYEDVDLCARIWGHGKVVMCCPSARVIHDAQRASHRRLRHMAWHARSAVRFLLKHRRPTHPELG